MRIQKYNGCSYFSMTVEDYREHQSKHFKSDRRWRKLRYWFANKGIIAAFIRPIRAIKRAATALWFALEHLGYWMVAAVLAITLVATVFIGWLFKNPKPQKRYMALLAFMPLASHVQHFA